jgi:hypothetical protein
MKASVNAIDSRALGRTVLDITEITDDDGFAAFERGYVEQYDPAYVAYLVPAEEIEAIHRAEKHGFCFMESQIRMSCDVANKFSVSDFHYRFELVQSEEDLLPVLDIASCAFSDDRFSIDPRIPPGVSAKRYRLYIMKSFASDDENVYRLVHDTTDETVAFKTHRILGNQEALLLLSAVKPEYDNTPVALINEFFEMNVFRTQAIRRLQTHISSRSCSSANLAIKGMGFRVEGGTVLLRKWYA